MKKLLLILVITGITLTAKAQDELTYKKFKLDFMAGGGLAASSDVKAGVVGTLEPHYSLKDNFSVGLRIEAAAFDYKSISTIYGTKVSLTTSYCATANYYLSQATFRPYIGGGVGLYANKPVKYYSFAESEIQAPAVNSIGIFPEIGFEAGHLRIAADYNLTGKSAGYFALKIGFFLGGGVVEEDD